MLSNHCQIGCQHTHTHTHKYFHRGCCEQWSLDDLLSQTLLPLAALHGEQAVQALTLSSLWAPPHPALFHEEWDVIPARGVYRGRLARGQGQSCVLMGAADEKIHHWGLHCPLGKPGHLPGHNPSPSLLSPSQISFRHCHGVCKAMGRIWGNVKLGLVIPFFQGCDRVALSGTRVTSWWMSYLKGEPQ